MTSDDGIRLSCSGYTTQHLWDTKISLWIAHLLQKIGMRVPHDVYRAVYINFIKLLYSILYELIMLIYTSNFMP